MRKKYYYFKLKQYGFNSVNLYNVLNINTINTAAAALSPIGAAALTIASVVPLSWSGSLFFSNKNKYDIILVKSNWNPQKNCFWNKIAARFEGCNSKFFYYLLKQNRIKFKFFPVYLLKR